MTKYVIKGAGNGKCVVLPEEAAHLPLTPEVIKRHAKKEGKLDTCRKWIAEQKEAAQAAKKNGEKGGDQ